MLKDWLAMLGKSCDSPEVSSVRARYGLTGKGPRMASQYESEEIPAAGVALMLVKAKVDGQPVPRAVYGITFYGTAREQRVVYGHDLPHRLRWDESQASVHARLGEPKTRAQLANSDGYEFPDYTLSIGFLRDGSRIKTVQILLSKEHGDLSAALA